MIAAERGVLRRVGRNVLLAAGYSGFGAAILAAAYLLVRWTCTMGDYTTGGCEVGPEAFLLVMAGLLALLSVAMLHRFFQRRKLATAAISRDQVEELRGTPTRVLVPKEFRFQVFDRQVKALVLNLPGALQPLQSESPLLLAFAVERDHGHWLEAWIVSVNAEPAPWPFEVEIISPETTGPHGWRTV
ncbi:MAG: hypothetical protein KGJ23_16000 [Euryarchaeota archaeon]|nr:hypothetical protein [Euryarchaeota archaeon]MDE1838102.1 hypothetical protein [Euryarchaeota archaeon]MDE2046593.1 hypothetical protein [Thermoplasmata archaeon]